MGYIAKLTIPKIQSNENVLLYIYRSTNSNDINTISKVSQLTPVIVINQSVANTIKEELPDPNNPGNTILVDKKHYIIYDSPSAGSVAGVTYNGPVPNNVPVNEYEYTINFIKLNSHTHINELVLNPLPINNSKGIVFYYSVIGVIQSSNQITHLSKVNGVLVAYIKDDELVRQLYSCDDYNDSESDIWKFVSGIEYSEVDSSIYIGNINKPSEISKYGLPTIETVPKISEVHASLNSLISNTFMTLEVQNPWYKNNKDFNFRKLKSYKVRNTYESLYGEFSVPTYQSLVPVSIEKMIILMRCNPSNETDVIPIDDTEANKFEIIRRDGIFYDSSKHKKLSLNPWIIPLENNKVSVFAETSIQENINMQISAVPGNKYVFDIYLIDVYNHVSDNCHYVLET